MGRYWKTVIGLIVVICAVFFMPFITVETKDSSGSSWRVPFASFFHTKDDSSISFTSFRSGYALRKDADNAFHSYEEEKCHGNTYYYHKENDVSLKNYETTGLFPVTLTYSFEEGNACEGWTYDDEVAWPFGKLEDVSFMMTPEESEANGFYVIEDGKSRNIGVYNDFSRLFKQGVYSKLRTMEYENGTLKTIYDIQLLEDAHFKVGIRTQDHMEEDIYARISDSENATGGKDVCVYRYASKNAEPIFLFEVK